MTWEPGLAGNIMPATAVEVDAWLAVESGRMPLAAESGRMPLAAEPARDSDRAKLAALPPNPLALACAMAAPAWAADEDEDEDEEEDPTGIAGGRPVTGVNLPP
jgi:hypothetical protein